MKIAARIQDGSESVNVMYMQMAGGGLKHALQRNMLSPYVLCWLHTYLMEPVIY